MNTSKILTVSEVAAAEWGNFVFGISGVIHKLHTPLRNPGWSLQNGVLRDPVTGKTIEFMLSKRDFLDEHTMIGKTITIRSTEGPGLLWKEQKPKPSVNGGRPFAKLEVEKTAVIDVGASNAGEPDLFTSSDRAVEARQPVSQPTHSTRKLGEKETSSGINVQQSINRLGALYLLISKEVQRIETLAKKPEEWSEERRAEARGLLFVQASRECLHHQLDPIAVEIEFDPDARERLMKSPKQKLIELAKGHEMEAVFYLRGKGVIVANCGINDITDEQASIALQNDDFVQTFQKAS